MDRPPSPLCLAICPLATIFAIFGMVSIFWLLWPVLLNLIFSLKSLTQFGVQLAIEPFGGYPTPPGSRLAGFCKQPHQNRIT